VLPGNYCQLEYLSLSSWQWAKIRLDTTLGFHWSSAQNGPFQSSSKGGFFGHVAKMDTYLTSLEHAKCQSEGCPRIGDAHPDVLVILGYTP